MYTLKIIGFYCFLFYGCVSACYSVPESSYGSGCFEYATYDEIDLTAISTCLQEGCMDLTITRCRANTSVSFMMEIIRNNLEYVVHRWPELEEFGLRLMCYSCFPVCDLAETYGQNRLCYSSCVHEVAPFYNSSITQRICTDALAYFVAPENATFPSCVDIPQFGDDFCDAGGIPPYPYLYWDEDQSDTTSDDATSDDASDDNQGDSAIYLRSTMSFQICCLLFVYVVKFIL